MEPQASKQRKQRKLIALTLTGVAAFILGGLGIQELVFKSSPAPVLVAQNEMVPELNGSELDSTESILMPSQDQLAANSATQAIMIQSEITPAPEEPKQATTPSSISPTKAPEKTAKQVAARKHTVTKGDTLSTISVQYYGTSRRWKEIYEANVNKIPDQNRIKVGTELIIPN